MLNEKIDGASAGDSQSPEVLIISPTRELTLQIYNEARKFVHNTIYKPVVCYGGTSVGHQLKQLERGCNILVGTPGRLLDFLQRKKVEIVGTIVRGSFNLVALLSGVVLIWKCFQESK